MDVLQIAAIIAIIAGAISVLAWATRGRRRGGGVGGDDGYGVG